MEADSYTAPTLAELATMFVDRIKAGEVKTGRSILLHCMQCQLIN